MLAGLTPTAGRQMVVSRIANGGGWVVALSRALPILPEVISCTAGLVRMPFRKFTVALACGSAPMGFLFAAIGRAVGDHVAGAARVAPRASARGRHWEDACRARSDAGSDARTTPTLKPSMRQPLVEGAHQALSSLEQNQACLHLCLHSCTM